MSRTDGEIISFGEIRLEGVIMILNDNMREVTLHAGVRRVSKVHLLFRCDRNMLW